MPFCTKTRVQPPPPAGIFLEIIGRDGKNMIHSLNDELTVTYTSHGVTQSARLNIYKVQVSATDTTPVAKYNGFIISDRTPPPFNGGRGFISSPSGQLGVRDFNLSLNGANIGTFYFDYFGKFSLSTPPQPSSTFKFNGVPQKWDTVQGFFNDGKHIIEEANSPGEFVYVLQMQ
jgi:hypothetical protein